MLGFHRNANKALRPVLIELRDGRRLRGTLRLAPGTTAGGLLAMADPFLTIRTSRGEIAFHRDNISAVLLADEEGEGQPSPLGTVGAAQAEGTPAQGKDRAAPPFGFDPCRLLGVSPGASREELKSAWRRRMAECHPDKVAAGGASDEVVAAAQRQAAAVNAAYQTLSSLRAG